MAGKAAQGEPLGRTAEEVAWAEALRGACEPEQHWRHRREFLLRNVGRPPAAGSAELQRLVSLSMVWANHVFLGCRYPPQVMEKALEMAEGIQVSDAPVRTTRDELVAKVKKRGISSSNEGVEEPPKKRAVEKSRDATDTEKDVKTPEAESPKETESTLPKKQEKDSSKDSESSQSTCSTNQAAVAALSAEAEEKPVNAENTTEQSPTPSSSEKESGENPPKEGKCENEPSPEKNTLSSGPPAAAKSTPQAEAVPPAAAKSAPQVAAVPSAAAKSAPQAGAVPPAAKSAPQAAAVPATTAKSATQTSASLLSSKNQASATPSVTKSVTQAGASLLLAPKSVAQPGTSLLLAPKSGAQAGTSLLLASKGSAKAGSSLLASKSSAEVAASLLAARSGTQQGASLLTSKSSAQVAASLLAARSGSQQGPSRAGAPSKGGTQAGSQQLASKSSSQAGESPAKALCKPLTSEDAKERQPFFNRLYKAVAWKLVAVGGFSPSVNHAELLNSSIQSVKATLDVAFVPLKELADLPQNKSSLENIVCELRCKSVYLGTGCGKSMENAKAVASREALKLFLKKKVIVKICKRKYKGREIEDLVLLDEESKPSNLPPALRNPREIM
ncbi:CDKN2A-interacting protein isoform X2 [Oxyura jamaicensis]|uniref:CDKN2A-interacting protein isoform X2 n=1 Tax=Oxyura jamaicensis TaxID=8884 RepID=UPI0015A5F225|nr:CDKN2A-interacting protein isoform X2 [Oxyura jamaicensis]